MTPIWICLFTHLLTECTAKQDQKLMVPLPKATSILWPPLTDFWSGYLLGGKLENCILCYIKQNGIQTRWVKCPKYFHLSLFFLGGGGGRGYWVVGDGCGLIAKMYTCIIYMNRFFYCCLFIVFKACVIFTSHTVLIIMVFVNKLQSYHVLLFAVFQKLFTQQTRPVKCGDEDWQTRCQSMQRNSHPRQSQC